jgi:Colicin immunity protein / pyocin immunity protein
VPREGLSREELIVLVRRIMAVDAESEAEHDRLIELFEANVPRPRASDLIFWPEYAAGEQRKLSAAEVVDLALSYKPMAYRRTSVVARPRGYCVGR